MNKIITKIRDKKIAIFFVSLSLLILILATSYLYKANLKSETEQEPKIDLAEAEELLNQANTLINEKRYSESIESLQKAQAAFPNDYNYNFKLGLSYYLNKDYDNAIKYIELSLPLATNNSFKSNTYNVLGNIYRDKKDTEKAITAYLESTDLNPKDQNPYLNLYRLYTQDNKLSEAKQILLKGRVNIPDSTAIKQALDNIK